MISLRTKDEVTSSASERLFAVADTPEKIANLQPEQVSKLIYPAGFYRTKAKSIVESARIIVEHHKGRVPNTRDLLIELPGVGVKTANLTLNLGFGIEAICVDTHVHRISNRLGWIKTTTPDASESALEKVLPKGKWIEVNTLFVGYGQRVCVPVSPKCDSECSLEPSCPKVGVTKHR